MFRGHEAANEQRVARYVPYETAEVFPLGRLAGAEQLGQRILVGQLIPMTVVLDPERAHEAASLSGEDDDVKHRGAGSRERDPPLQPDHRDRHEGDQHSHRFALAYVPMSWAEPSTCPCIAASTSFFWAPALSSSRVSSAYSLKK